MPLMTNVDRMSAQKSPLPAICLAVAPFRDQTGIIRFFPASALFTGQRFPPFGTQKYSCSASAMYSDLNTLLLPANRFLYAREALRGTGNFFST